MQAAGSLDEDTFIDLFERFMDVQDKIIMNIIKITSETQLMRYLQSLKHSFDLIISIIVKYFCKSPNIKNIAMDLVLQRKGLSIDILAFQRLLILRSNDTELRDKLNKLNSLRSEISKKRYSNIFIDDAYQMPTDLLNDFMNKKESLESEFSGRIDFLSVFDNNYRQKIAKVLPEGYVLIEIICLKIYNPTTDIYSKSQYSWEEPHYIAFLLSANNHEEIDMIDLGLCKNIDRLIIKWTRSFMQGVVDRENGSRLQKVLLDKILSELGNCNKHIIISPDGALNLLPFETLPYLDNYLIDEYHISYLNSGRDLLRFDATLGSQTDPIVIADPDFDLYEYNKGTAKNVISNSRYSHDILFSPLEKITGEDGKIIAKKLNVNPWIGKQVIEGKLKRCSSPALLHMSTHGFFVPNQLEEWDIVKNENVENDDMNEIVNSWLSTKNFAKNTLSKIENPLLRAGLALAGANTFIKQGSLPEEAEDGILTAEDVSCMDLGNTELVVSQHVNLVSEKL